MTMILVKSSSRDEPYVVDVSVTDAGLHIDCDCPAGSFGKFCKHKIAIASGDNRILFSDDQLENFNSVSELIANSDYPGMIDQLHESEKQLESAKKGVKKMKENIARLMKQGLK